MIRGTILVISGPSGSGKSSLITQMLQEIEEAAYFSISTTTREIRGSEVDGLDYFFISKEQFEKDIENGFFLEWANVHGNYYGTSLKPIQQALDEGKIVIFDIDVQGHAIVREKFPDLTTSIFLTTPSAKILKERLVKRETDSGEVIEKRLENAVSEMERIHEYDYLLVNDVFEKALNQLICIVKTVKLKTSDAEINHFRKSW